MNFNTKTIHSVTSLTMRQIDYWDRTHFIKPSVSEASGHGSVRLYSFSDLIQMKVAKTLMDKGISLQKIRKAIIYLKKNMPDIERPLSELRFLTDGNTVFIITRNDKQIIDTLKKGQLVFSIALGDLIEELKGKVIDIEKNRKYQLTARGRKYPVILHADTEDGGYWVECPSLQGCASQGDTVEEALGMIKDAIEGHLEILAEDEKKDSLKESPVTGPHNLKPDRVVKAFERAGWTARGQRGSHMKPTKEGNPNILSIPVHKGKPIKQGLLRDQIEKAGLKFEEFMEYYR